MVFMPIGDWHEDSALKATGTIYREILVSYAYSMRRLLEEVLPSDVVEALISGFVYDLRSSFGLGSSYYTYHGVRV